MVTMVCPLFVMYACLRNAEDTGCVCNDIGIERIKKNETDIRKISGGRDT